MFFPYLVITKRAWISRNQIGFEGYVRLGFLVATRIAIPGGLAVPNAKNGCQYGETQRRKEKRSFLPLFSNEYGVFAPQILREEKITNGS